MSEPFLGQILPVGFNFAPPGWLPCDGSLVNIADYDALYALIGTTYGGDGQTTFGLPNLSGAVAIGAGTGNNLTTYVVGASGGAEGVTMTSGQLPVHTHPMLASGDSASSNTPGPNGLAANSGQQGIPYSTAAPSVAMSSQALAPTGGSQPHENRQPSLCIKYIIATVGQYPVQG